MTVDITESTLTVEEPASSIVVTVDESPTIIETPAATITLPVETSIQTITSEEPTIITADIDPTFNIIEIGIIGPAGPAGPSGAGTLFTFIQSLPASTWTIDHNLGHYPTSIIVMDTLNRQVFGELSYTSVNQLVLVFSAPFSGEAYIS